MRSSPLCTMYGTPSSVPAPPTCSPSRNIGAASSSSPTCASCRSRVRSPASVSKLIGTGSSSPASHCFDLAARGVGARRHAAISGRSIGALDFSRQLSFAFRVKATGLRRHSCAGPLSQSQPGGEEWILETIADRSDRFLLAYDATRIQGFERLVHRRRGNSVA